MLHDEELLGGEECGHPGEGHVGPGDTSLGVQGGEPFLRENAQTDRGLVNWANSGGEVDQVPLLVGGGDRQASAGHYQVVASLGR